MRDIYFVLIAALLAVLIGFGIYVFLPQGTAVEQQTPPENTNPVSASELVSFEVLAQGVVSNATERKNYIARDQAALTRIWALAYGEETEVPDIDFETQQVIGVFDGEHGTGGYNVDVTSVHDTKDARVVTIVRTEPGEGCITTQAITSPFLIIALPASDKAPGKEETTRSENCG